MTGGAQPPQPVLHLTPSIGPGAAGVGAVVPNLARAQRQCGLDVVVWCTDPRDDVEWAAGAAGMSSAHVRGFAVRGPRRLAYSPAMERAAGTPEAAGFAVVHQHGLWTATSRVTQVLRARFGTPAVVAAHGALGPLGLRTSRFKKGVAALLFERRNLAEASCLHAVAEREIADYRNYGLRNPIAVIPNGISALWLASPGDGTRFRAAYGIPPGARLLLFLGRLVPGKGAALAVRALASRRKQLRDWILVVAGSDERGHRATLERLVADLGLGAQVRFVGALHDQPKRDAFAAAEALILPSLEEVTGLVVLEALGAGVPVIATKASPWQDLERHACGWWVDATDAGLAEALGEASALDAGALREAGARGRALVESSYLWPRSAAMTLRLYEWLRGRGERPEFVATN